MSLREWLASLLPERIVLVPRGFERPGPKPEGERDPVFLREMADSMRACPVVYQNMSNMLRARYHLLATPLPATTQAERDALKWRQDQAQIEAALLDVLLRAPATAAHAITEFTTHEKDAQAEKYGNWTLEETKS